MPPKSSQAARRAAAKARSDARSEVRLECCEARRTGARDLGRRFEHLIQAVYDPGEDEGFVYTVGASPEFLIEDVPREHVRTAAATLNYLVDQARSGNPVATGHTVRSAEGFVFVAEQLSGVALRDALGTRCTRCQRGASVVLLRLVAPVSLPASTDGFEPFSGVAHRL